MQNTEDQQPHFFALLIMMQVLSAGTVLWNEIMSIHNRFPGGNYPIEHEGSWLRVILFSILMFLCPILLLIFTRKGSTPIKFPTVIRAFGLSLLPMASSIFVSHYLSWVGWCCETSLAFHFGFPFSFLLAPVGFNLSSVQPYEDLSLIAVLQKPDLVYGWATSLPDLFLNILFWYSIALVIAIGAKNVKQRTQQNNVNYKTI